LTPEERADAVEDLLRRPAQLTGRKAFATVTPPRAIERALAQT